MRPMFSVTAGVTLMLLMSGAGWAGGKGRPRGQNDSGKEKEVTASFNKQFQWEEKVVGPKAGIDHDKIAAMQEEGRREEAAKKREEMAPGHKKADVRPDGINGPATATLPTMDIEKAAPAGSVRHQPVRKASYTPPKAHDDIDNVLAANGVGDGSSAAAEGLNSVLGKKPAARSTKHAKHARSAKRRR